MGRSVGSGDLVEKMSKRSGFIRPQEIDIKFKGLRSGGKRYEKLLNDLENTLTMHHHQSMIAKVRENNLSVVREYIAALSPKSTKNSNIEVVRQMKVMVPEFKSQNSIYEQLDDEVPSTTNG